MFSPFLAHILLIAIVAASIVLMLVRPRGIAEVHWVGGGAFLLVLLRLIPFELARRAVAAGTDVYLFLAGMMLLSELALDFGVFDWMASVAEEHANGSAVRLFTLIYLVGTLVTIFMSNDATAVVLTPAVLAVVRRAKAEPLPYLFGCALIANAASFVLPISNPANLVVFRARMPPLVHWLASFALPSALAIVSTYFVLRWRFRSELREPLPVDRERTHLTGNGRLALGGIVVVALVMMVVSAMKIDLGLPACICALAVTGGIAFRARINPLRIVRRVSWSVLPLVAGLFILMEAMVWIGATRYTAAALTWVETLPAAAGVLLTGAVVGVGNNVVNNLPLGLIAGSALNSAHVQRAIENAVLVGIDLGPNLSVTGSLATILWLIAMRREGLHVDFVTFLKVGVIAMPVALALALASVALQYRHL
jgi:arsenical pump membrane protein